jgi:myo-inositol-1(or 4)-monophosphatase
MVDIKEIPEQNELSRRLVKRAEECALKVGPYLLQMFSSGITTEIKGGYHDLVTEADRIAEQMITKQIFRTFPDSTILGEESGQQGKGDFLWYVDPIDGTNNFISGIPLFCVSIAVSYQGQMLAGVVFEPVRNELITASLDGAFLNGIPIHSSGVTSDAAALLLSSFPYEGGQATPKDFEYYETIISRFRAVRRLGSTALELAYVASGRADITFQTNANPWDVAAGMFLVHQAGGIYSIPENANPTIQNTPWLSPQFVASCPQFDLNKSCLHNLLSSGVEE